MSLNSHLAELKKKHNQLSAEVDKKQRSPGSCPLELKRMKKQKLKLKDEIQRLTA